MTNPSRPEEHGGTASSWAPLLWGGIGLLLGGGVGVAVGFSDGFTNAAQLGVLGGFIGMVMFVVPATSRLNAATEEAVLDVEQHRGLFSRRPSHVMTPEAGLASRPVPNRNSEPTDRIAGGLVVRVLRRSGRWVRLDIESTDEVWVDGRRLEPVDDPPRPDAPAS